MPDFCQALQRMAGQFQELFENPAPINPAMKIRSLLFVFVALLAFNLTSGCRTARNTMGNALSPAFLAQVETLKHIERLVELTDAFREDRGRWPQSVEEFRQYTESGRRINWELYEQVFFRSIDGNSLDIEFRFAPFQIDPGIAGGWTVNIERAFGIVAIPGSEPEAGMHSRLRIEMPAIEGRATNGRALVIWETNLEVHP